mgnify:CR=1 FL=1
MLGLIILGARSRDLAGKTIEGTGVIEGGSKFLGRAFSELVEAGQDFKARLKQRLADNTDLLESIMTDFKTAHQSSQSRDTQKAVEKVKQ